ncbi:hypothetical protein [Streptomyces sp. NPDC051546]|uniref:hypothetical protein n=1 Tax=Streptomyces sp. NPDC051546 TaxID=3365655 RepID=UPI0037AFACAD
MWIANQKQRRDRFDTGQLAQLAQLAELGVDVTGHPDGLTFDLPPEAERTDRNGCSVGWADELLRVIEQAAAEPVGTLITSRPTTTRTPPGSPRIR